MTGDEKRNPNFLPMQHGKLVINIPKKMFKSGTVEVDEKEAAKFISNISSRYPWLTQNALHVILEEAKEAMERDVDSRRRAHEKARDLISKGDIKAALRFIEKHLIEHPEDSDAWYVTGEVLCKMGRQEEGFRAMGKARELSGLKD